MDISKSVIVITGGAQGLGLAMAKYFNQLGAQIAIVDINANKVAEVVSQLDDAKGYVLDVSVEMEVEGTFNAIQKDYGQIDVLINNAGILRDGMLLKEKDGVIEKLPLAHWQQVIDVNLTGVFLCGREVASQMARQSNPGVIINISSISRYGNFGQSNYTAAKAGVAGLTVTWAKELARFNIRCAGIAPGFIETEMTQQMPEAAIKNTLSAIPMKRMGTPNEIAQTARFIIENDYINGRIIEIDGGLRI